MGNSNFTCAIGHHHFPGRTITSVTCSLSFRVEQSRCEDNSHKLFKSKQLREEASPHRIGTHLDKNDTFSLDVLHIEGRFFIDVFTSRILPCSSTVGLVYCARVLLHNWIRFLSNYEFLQHRLQPYHNAGLYCIHDVIGLEEAQSNQFLSLDRRVHSHISIFYEYAGSTLSPWIVSESRIGIFNGRKLTVLSWCYQHLIFSGPVQVP